MKQELKMKKHSLMIAFWLMLVSAVSYAQNDSAKADEAAIRAVIQNMADAWTAGDGKKLGDLFFADADFTVWNGMFLNGRESIALGHQQIFDTFYKDTKLQMKIRKIRFLNGATAIVHTTGVVVKKSEEFPAEPQVVPVFVLSREKGKWRIVAFQNTRIERTAAATQPIKQ